MSTTTNGDANVITYGDHKVDVSRLPENVVMKLLARAIGHVLGNETASKVASLVEKRAMPDNELGPMSDTEKAVAIHDTREAFIAAMYDGTWGSGTRGPSGPRVPPIEAEFNSVVAGKVRAILDAAIKKAGGAYDKATKTWTWKMGDQLVTRTLDEATTNYLADANYGEARRAACMEQAEEQLRVKAARAKAIEAAKSESVEALGI